jgi:hypothetical protein
MKTIFNTILYPATLLLLMVGCIDQNGPAESIITGSITNTSECKNFISGDLKFAEADTFSCVHYLYDDVTHKVIMNHINAGFNCCPLKIYCEIVTIGDTIIIHEFEKEQGCNCECLFDLDIELQGIDQNKYQVRFAEPYAEGQPELIFEMDLTSGNEGEYCVVRKGYPWGG